MSYTKQNFESGEKLYASQLNSMDEQIAKNTEEITSLKENGSGNKRILLFKDVVFTKTTNYKSFDDLGISELVQELGLMNDGYATILNKYRMIFFIKSNFVGCCCATIEYNPPIPLDSSISFKAVIPVNFQDNKFEMSIIEHISAYNGAFAFCNIPNEATVKVTCYLEEL